MGECKQKSKLPHPYRLPDGNVLKFDSRIRFATPEILFAPQQIGLERETGLQHLVFDGVMACDIDLRRELLKNIVICGANLMFDGIAKRIKNEVSNLSADNNLQNCKVNAIKSCKYSQMIGGSILTAMQSFEEKWITREEYEEYG